MNLLFRLSKKVEGFEDIENTKYFFSDILPSRDKNYFYDVFKRGKDLKNGDVIYFAYDSYIVAQAIFCGEIITNLNRGSDKYIYGHKLNDLEVLNTDTRLNNKIFGTRTRYIKSSEMQNEINKILNLENIIYPDEIDYPVLTEGATKQVTVNAYERSPKARAQCIEEYGYKCSICNFDFEKVYGKIGKDFIHVHHIKPLSEIKDEYTINPAEDLRPVCPNCHAMLHKRVPAYSIEEIKSVINSISKK